MTSATVTPLDRPAASGVYPIADAAAFIRATTPQLTTEFPLSTRHLYQWVREGLAGQYLVGVRGDDVALTFLDLVTLRLVAVFRSYGAKPRELRIAHDTLEAITGASHPFATEQIWNEGPDLFYKIEGIPIAVTRRLQRAFPFIENNLKPVHNLTFGQDSLAQTWEPVLGVVLLDPKVSFGEPCIKGTRVPTETLWALHRAGDSIQSLAWAYNVSVPQVEAAVDWEEKIDKLAA